MNRLKTKLSKIELKNPVTVASGTFGTEFSSYFNLNKLGAIVTNTITRYPKEGNRPPRLVETPSGLINSIGLQNPGVEAFIDEDLQDYRKLLRRNTPLIVSFSGSTVQEFVEIADMLEVERGISGYEVNISCPNVEKEGLSFGVDAKVVYELTSKIRKVISPYKELIVKLTPNVTDITDIAKAAEDGGCDSLALINTLVGMKVDWETGRPLIGRGYGGLSGPAIMPIALYNVFRVAQVTRVPIIAMGGISNYRDALEFFCVGASVVAIGTANFINPFTTIEIINDLKKYCSEERLRLSDLCGATTSFLI